MTSSRDQSMALGDRLAVSLATTRHYQAGRIRSSLRMREPPWLSLLGTCFLVLIRMELARLREVWYELEIDGSTNQDELKRWLVSLRENPRQHKSIFGFTNGHDGNLRASVGNRPPQYCTRSPFFLATMGSTCKKVTLMGTKNGRVPH